MSCGNCDLNHAKFKGAEAPASNQRYRYNRGTQTTDAQFCTATRRSAPPDTPVKIALQILATFLIVGWPMVAMMSPMMIGAPGAINRLKPLVTIVVVLSYPLAIGLLFYWLGWNLWFVSARTLAFLTALAPALALYFYGRPIVNLLRGIANEGYVIVRGAVYFDGKIIKYADFASFEATSVKGSGVEKSDAQDRFRRYLRGKPLPK